MGYEDRHALLRATLTRLSAAAELHEEVTLSPEEAEAVVKWIRSEKYRHPARRR